MEHYYRVDKDSAFDQLAVSMGASTGITPEKRKLANDKRRKRRAGGVEKITNEENEEENDEATLMQPPKKKPAPANKITATKSNTSSNSFSTPQSLPSTASASTSPMEDMATSNEVPSTSRSASTITAPTEDMATSNEATSTARSLRAPSTRRNRSVGDEVLDPNIGRTVWLYTKEKGKKFGWCEAKIKSRKATGDYVAEYCGWQSKYNAIITDLSDETMVLFTCPVNVESA